MDGIECSDRVALDEWHVVAALESLPPGHEVPVRLLDTDLSLMRSAGDIVAAWPAASARALPVCIRHGHVRTSLGNPAKPLFDIPDSAEPGRRTVTVNSGLVQAAAPRAVENFIELGPALATVDETGVLVTGQDFICRVPHPYCAILSDSRERRREVIALFVQPVTEESIVVHLLVSASGEAGTDDAIRTARQLIFAQDKAILENQIPKRLPLHPHAEFCSPADAGSAAYRRWLSSRGVRYGTIPA